VPSVSSGDGAYRVRKETEAQKYRTSKIGSKRLALANGEFHLFLFANIITPEILEGTANNMP
jgi:hypothetical protein